VPVRVLLVTSAEELSECSEERHLRGAHYGQAPGRGIPFGEQPARSHRQRGVALHALKRSRLPLHRAGGARHAGSKTLRFRS
jgi:hypothetical protein